jgi:hypothetical protein
VLFFTKAQFTPPPPFGHRDPFIPFWLSLGVSLQFL